MSSLHDESEYRTRRQRIDPLLQAQGWTIGPFDPGLSLIHYPPHALTEYDTASGPADYALCVAGQPLGIVEAKKITLGPQNVLTQAERYSRGVTNSPFDFHGFRVPFLYSTNGEVLWFHDIRHELNRSRRIATFHTPAALQEMLARDFDGACSWFAAMPNNHPLLRPYQVEANTAIEQAIAGRKRQMLVAMATGTGKTFTLVNQVYRLMKSGVARRILFLVDRRALAAQAVNAFASFEPEPGLKFDRIYEVYSQRFRREDLGDDAKFDPKEMPAGYLLDPQPGHAFVCADGKEYKPEDYLVAFARFIQENLLPIEAVRILLNRPQDWNTEALAELKQKLATTPERFTLDHLEKAHAARYHKNLVDIISMVKHAAREQEPLLTAPERVERAFAKITAGHQFTEEQQKWLERIRAHVVVGLSIGRGDFDNVPVLLDPGGWKPADRAFAGRLGELLHAINEAPAA